MPKLDGTHLPERLAARLANLKAGKEVGARDVRKLLSDEQVAAMDAAWEQQQALRKLKRARTKAEQKKLGWKSIREIHIEAYERAVKEANEGLLDELERLQLEATKRQMRIYLDAVSAEIKDKKDLQTAKYKANNDLTRAGLNRIDGQRVMHQSKRDREIWEMERKIQEKARSEMTPDELEQLEIWEEHEKALKERLKKTKR